MQLSCHRRDDGGKLAPDGLGSPGDSKWNGDCFGAAAAVQTAGPENWKRKNVSACPLLAILPKMKPRKRFTTSMASLSLVTPLLGQTNAPPAPASEKTVLDRVVVEGVPIEELIVPTARPFNSVYGTDRSILDTPRNVTIISREQLDAINIRDVRDFSKLTSSSYTRSNFGAPTTPDLRTQVADTFNNGMRIGLTSNGNGLPINFNSVESVNIVKGPASVVYGASQYVGGYVDYITKRPQFDGFHGEVFAEAGMYDQYRWGLDVGGPVNDKLAYRLAYSGEDSESFYVDGFRKSQAIYHAVSWMPNEDYDLFFNQEFFWANYTENFGINRPTQELIDDGIYQTGINSNPAPSNGVPGAPPWANGYVDANGNPLGFGAGPGGSTAIGVVGGPAAPISDPQNSRWVTSGFPFVNRITLGDKVKIDRSNRLLRPGDDSEGLSYNAQVIQTVRLSDDTQIANNTLFRYVRRETMSSYYYSEIIDPSWSLDNRTELRMNFEHHALNTGLSVRYQSVRAFNDFFNEPANVWDLTKDHSFINYYNSVNFPNGFTSVPVPGWPGRYYTPDNGDSGTSQSVFVGPFIQEDWKITEKLSLLAGGRIDVLSTDYRLGWTNPFGGSQLLADSTVVGLPNANGSLIYKWTPEFSTYGTYNYSQNPAGAIGNGGGITTGGNANFAISNLKTEAILYELGAKQTLLENRLFLNAALFQQERVQLQLDRSTVEFKTQGIEFELNYQPNRNFFLTFGYSYTDSEVSRPEFAVNNTDLPFYSGAGQNAGPGPYKRQGVPEHLLNFLASYKFDFGLGFSANIVSTSEVNNNASGTLVIPWQYSLDLGVFYQTKRWEARVSLLNVTDEENWSAPNAVYGNESILAELPFRAEGRLTLKF